MFLKLRKNLLDISHVQAVIFDMDGTLVESEHIWTQAKQVLIKLTAPSDGDIFGYQTAIVQCDSGASLAFHTNLNGARRTSPLLCDG
tara:strand:+ start:219 stop:479 length:261 start_codon:yes stop_codon:yes gene_type:complete